MKLVSMWVILGMSLFLGTGSVAQPPDNPPPKQFGDFKDVASMAARTVKPKDKTLTTPANKYQTPSEIQITVRIGIPYIHEDQPELDDVNQNQLEPDLILPDESLPVLDF